MSNEHATSQDDTRHTPPLSRDEVSRRLPALDRITDVDLRSDVVTVSAQAPAYFWTAPASTSGYHHPVCRKKHGLWIHTLMVFTAVERLADSYEERYGVDPDHARAAALLHDQRKNGPPEDPSDSSTHDHAVRMAEVARGRLPDPVTDAIAEHMGPWYAGPEPETPVGELLHAADMLASTENVTIALPGPIPEELRQYDVPKAEL